MSNLSYIDKLLDGVDVEWMALGKTIKSLKTGLNPRKNFQLNTSDAKNFYITVREIQNGKIVFLDKTDRVNDIALELINNRSNLEVGDILFSGTGTVGRTSVIEVNPENWNIKEGIYVIKPNKEVINSRYLFYLLNTQYIVKEYSKKIVGSPVVSLPMNELKKIQFPIPTLDIQAEIVRVLDTFTELTSELTSELKARKQQYAYYRYHLLKFNKDQVKYKNLGDVVNIKNGKDWKRLGSGDIPVYGSGGIMKYVDTYAYDKPTVLIPRKGSITNIFYVETPFWNVDTIYYTEIDTKQIIPKFFYYYMKTIDLMKLDTGSGRPSLTQAILNIIEVPVPSLPEQERIVAILDKFDALTNSLTEGLPREIALRHQQYEYYCELLLSFSKPDEEIV